MYVQQLFWSILCLTVVLAIVVIKSLDKGKEDFEWLLNVLLDGR